MSGGNDERQKVTGDTRRKYITFGSLNDDLSKSPGN